MHSDRSLFKPTQNIEFLVFVIDSVDMNISVNSEKPNCNIHKIKLFLINSGPTITNFFRFDSGSVISIITAVQVGRLRQRTLEKKENFIKKPKQNSNCSSYNKRSNRRIKLVFRNYLLLYNFYK